MDVIGEDIIIQVLDPDVDDRVIINNLSQIYNNHYLNIDEKKYTKSSCIFIWWYRMLPFWVSIKNLKKERGVGDEVFQ